MPISKPYHLTVRQLDDGTYDMSGRIMYVKHPSYSDDPMAYIRGYRLIQKDLLTLFEYIEPAQQNINTYSLRTFELLLRTCTEIEANFKSILRANTFTQPTNRYVNMTDYYKVNASHFLSDYEVKLPHWKGGRDTRQPFSVWGSGSFTQPAWYDAYNKAKHDRTQNLHRATLGNLVDAYCALAVLIASQFYVFDFSSNDGELTVDDGLFTSTANSYVSIKFPQNVPALERYDFMWGSSSLTSNPFQKFNYDALP